MMTDRYGRTYDDEGCLCHGDWRISLNTNNPPAPTGGADKWSYEHKNFDGPGDDRYGYAPTWREAIRQIDESLS